MSDSGSGSEDEGAASVAVDRRKCLDIVKTKNIVEGTDQWECRGCQQVFVKKKAARQHRYRVNAWLRKSGMAAADGDDGDREEDGGKAAKEKKRKAREEDEEDGEGAVGDGGDEADAAGSEDGDGEDEEDDSDGEDAAPTEKRKRGPKRGKRGGARHRKSEEVCRAFLTGTCARGVKCKFKHEKPKAEPSVGGAGSKWGSGKKKPKKDGTKKNGGGKKVAEGDKKAKPEWGSDRTKKFKKSKA